MGQSTVNSAAFQPEKFMIPGCSGWGVQERRPDGTGEDQGPGSQSCVPSAPVWWRD